jgi:hypothetical protein
MQLHRWPVQAPLRWVERIYHKVICLKEADKGGRSAAQEQPELFTEEIRPGSGPRQLLSGWHSTEKLHRDATWKETCDEPSRKTTQCAAE